MLGLAGVWLVIGVAMATPLWQPPNPFHTSMARNIRHLPCVSRRSGEAGTCMFAFTCAKMNGTHLGTCIDRFYFGSCCKVPEDVPGGEVAVTPPDDNSLEGATTSRIRPAITQKPHATHATLATSTPYSSPSTTQATTHHIATSPSPTQGSFSSTSFSSSSHGSSPTRRPSPPPFSESPSTLGLTGTTPQFGGNTVQQSTGSTYQPSQQPTTAPPTLVTWTTIEEATGKPPPISIRPQVSESSGGTHKPIYSTTVETSSPKPTATSPQTVPVSSIQPSVSTSQRPPPSTANLPVTQRPPSTALPSSVSPHPSESPRPPVSTHRPIQPITSPRPPPSTLGVNTQQVPVSTISPPQPSSPRPTTRPTQSPSRPPPSSSSKPSSGSPRPPPSTSKPPPSSQKPTQNTSKPPSKPTQKPTSKPSGTPSKPKPSQKPTAKPPSKPVQKPKPTAKPKPTSKPQPTTRPTTRPTTTTTTTTTKPSTTTQTSTSETWVPVSVSTHAPSTQPPTNAPTTTRPVPSEASSTPSSTAGSTTSPGVSSSGSTASVALPSVMSTTPAPVTTTTPSYSVLYNMSNYKDVCGRRLFPESRVVGGDKSSFGKWPWQISLRQWRTSTYLHKCGAALLNENWAITAAHCVENVPPSDLLLRLGEHDLSIEDEPFGYQERRVQIVASHPQFDPRTFEYDLALLRFYEPVVFQPNIIPICVPEDDTNFVGTTAFVTGWGRLYEDGPLPSVLQEVSVPVINNTLCETMYRAAGYIEHIPDIFICAGWKKGGFDSCEGDSGGPMVIQRPDKRWLLAGVISWGIGCAEPNQPGVYTRISQFRHWINQILQF